MNLSAKRLTGLFSTSLRSRRVSFYSVTLYYMPITAFVMIVLSYFRCRGHALLHVSLLVIVGPRGSPGQAGQPGGPGIAGDSGATGFLGSIGRVGEPGAIGVSGQPGVVGQPGVRGAPGSTGPIGWYTPNCVCYVQFT